MAVSMLCGFELRAVGGAHAVDATVTWSGGSGSVATTSIGRSGGFGVQATASSSANTTACVVFDARRSGGTQATLFQSVRFYVQVMIMPPSGASIVLAAFGSTTTVPVVGTGTSQALRLNGDGTLSVKANGNTSFTSGDAATSSNALSVDATWHRIDLDVGWNAGAGIRVSVDGTVWASVSTGTAAQWAFAFLGAAAMSNASTGQSGRVRIDDVAYHDSELPATLNDYTVSILKPASNNAVGNWKRNDGITTINMWDATDNTPPTGTAVTAVLGADYVQNGTAGSNVANDNLDLNCNPYTSISGLTASSQVLAVQSICNDAQQVTTGSPKSGALAISANPTGVALTTFDFGLPNGTAGSTSAAAQGAFPSGWGTHRGEVNENPTVTVSSGPVVRVRRTGTYTRVVSVDFMGVYVMWEAAASTAASLVFSSHRLNPAMLRR